MNRRYVLGVDGGNTKTHYFLYDISGNFVDYIRAGTCSHEKMADAYQGAEREIENQVLKILSKNKIKITDIAFSVFGLAGADFNFQIDELKNSIREIGFENFLVVNDGYLAVKAGSENGCGICSINGTGTVTVGIDEKGDTLQVGGIGEISSDAAGAKYIALRGAALIYNQIYRLGAKTLLKDMAYNEFGISSDKDYAEQIVNILNDGVNVYKFNLLMEKAEKKGDMPLICLMENIGEELAKSTAGCIKLLSFESTINIILAGSVWVKGNFEAMFKSYEQTLRSLVAQKFKCLKLTVPPAIGAVIWAIEEAAKLNGLSPHSFSRKAILKNKVLENL